MVIAALLVGGAATAFVRVTQANQAAAHEAALATHATALTGYEAAWTDFAQQASDTRDDQAQLSMTSLDNTDEVVASFDAALAAADALDRTDFSAPSAAATDTEIAAETERIDQARSDVARVTSQLAETSAFFLSSHRTVAAGHLADEADSAEATLTGVRDRADAELATQLEHAIADARALAEDPKAHPTDLRKTLEALVTLTGEVQASAGPDPAQTVGRWCPAPGVSLQRGGNGCFTVSQTGLIEDKPIPGATMPLIPANWTRHESGCLTTGPAKPGDPPFWFCPAGTPLPPKIADEMRAKTSENGSMIGTDDQGIDRLASWYVMSRSE